MRIVARLRHEIVAEASELGPGHYALRFKLGAPAGRSSLATLDITAD